jgi:hypothetical protein
MADLSAGVLAETPPSGDAGIFKMPKWGIVYGVHLKLKIDEIRKYSGADAYRKDAMPAVALAKEWYRR